ncbi:MAG: hypothetical protein HYY06_02830 [Deltaproteobacteria bacterium]|nr:hypothetical protein [Deltaproteobacteria bacterium]
MNGGGLHEDYRRPPRRPVSNRAFGVAIGVACAFFATWPIVRGGSPRWVLLAVGSAVAATAVVLPRLFGPAAAAWSRVTGVVERIVGVVVLAIAFFVVLTPVAVASRLFGRDPLGLRRRPGAPSFWHRREETRTPAESMKVQF